MDLAKNLPRDVQLLILRKGLSMDQRRGLGIPPGRVSVPTQLRDSLAAVFERLNHGLFGDSWVKLRMYRIHYSRSLFPGYRHSVVCDGGTVWAFEAVTGKELVYDEVAGYRVV